MVSNSVARLTLFVSCAWSIAAGPAHGSELVSSPGIVNHTFHRVAASLAVGDGVLWVGTSGGGVLAWNTSEGTFQKSTRLDGGLPDNTVAGIAVDPASGDVWVATSRGLGRLPAGSESWEVIDSASGDLTTDVTTSLAFERGGALWVGTFDDGAFRFDGEEWTHFRPDNSGLSDSLVESIVVGTDGAIWLSSFGGGVDRYFDGAWTQFTPATTGTPAGLCTPVTSSPAELGLISFFTRVLAVDPVGGAVWIRNVDDGFCLLNGVSRFAGGDWATYTSANSELVSNQVRAATVDSSGATWLGTAEGVSRLEDARWTTFRAGPGELLDDNVLALATEGDSVWIGSFDGLTRHRDGAFEQFVPEGLPGPNVRGVAVHGGDDEVWFATSRGAARLADESWLVLGRDDLGTGDVRAVHVDGGGDVWIGTHLRGVALVRGETVVDVFDVDSSQIGLASVTAITSDPDGTLWFASDLEGASRLAGGEWTRFREGAGGLVSDFVQDIAVDSVGDVWFATSRGVSAFDGARWREFTSEDGLPSDFVRAIAVAPDGSVWAGTFSSGLAVFDGEQWSALEDAAAPGAVRDVAFAPDGSPWIATWGAGVATRQDGLWTTITPADGLIAERLHALDVARDGRIWIGTDFGVSVVDPQGSADRFRRGDADCDGLVDLTDAVRTFNFLFLGGPAPCCLDAADADDTGSVDLTAGVYTLGFLFLGGPAPPAPGPFDCGVDETADGLGCAAPRCP